MITVNAPVPFQGTDEEKIANYSSHVWTSFDPEESEECMNCFSKSYHKAAFYPCGTNPPRQIITREQSKL